MSDSPDTPDTPDTKGKKKSRHLTVRLGEEEIMMVDALKGSPYFVNVSEYVRASLRHLFEKRTSKSGRGKKDL